MLIKLLLLSLVSMLLGACLMLWLVKDIIDIEELSFLKNIIFEEESE